MTDWNYVGSVVLAASAVGALLLYLHRRKPEHECEFSEPDPRLPYTPTFFACKTPHCDQWLYRANGVEKQGTWDEVYGPPVSFEEFVESMSMHGEGR